VAVTLVGSATEQELMEDLAGRLTSYQRPVAITVVDQLPRTPSLKVSRPRPDALLQRPHPAGTGVTAGMIRADGRPARQCGCRC
jgi:acyl-coenzyme A synthetase/AMP-(fatty) acid ligase